MSGFWNWWIAGLTALNVVGALWLLWATSRRKPGEQKASPDTTGHKWDGDLEEYNNPLPRWWLWLFYGTVAFSVGYLVLFPGFGAFRGTLDWSQDGQHAAQVEKANQTYYREFERFTKMDIAQLQRDPDAMRIAKNLFGNNCAMCHGSDARGAKGFPNLHAENYQYGRDPDTVVATIGGGRQGIMPGWQESLGDEGVEQVAQYVYSLAGQPADAALAAAGKARFDTFCAACHGVDAKGNTALGAPNLTDSNWVYGGSLETIRETVRAGRKNAMPAHLDLLGEQKVKLLAAYVLSLSGQPTASAAPGAADAPGS